MLKNFSTWAVYCPQIYKNYLTVVIISKCFKFQNDWFKIVRIRYICLQFCYISLKRFRSYSKFTISFTRRYRTKLCAIVSNTDYFKPIILKFKTFIYKIIYNFCTCEGNIPPSQGGSTCPLGGRNVITFLFLDRTPQNMQNLWLNYMFVII